MAILKKDFSKSKGVAQVKTNSRKDPGHIKPDSIITGSGILHLKIIEASDLLDEIVVVTNNISTGVSKLVALAGGLPEEPSSFVSDYHCGNISEIIGRLNEIRVKLAADENLLYTLTN